MTAPEPTVYGLSLDERSEVLTYLREQMGPAAFRTATVTEYADVVLMKAAPLIAARAVEAAARANAETARAAVMEVMGWDDDRHLVGSQYPVSCWHVAGEIVQAVVEAIVREHGTTGQAT